MCQLWCWALELCWKTKLLPCGPQVFTLELTLSAPHGPSRPGLVELLGFVAASGSPVKKVLTKQWHCHHLPCPFELPGLEGAGSSALSSGACDPLGWMNLSFL